MTEKPGNQDSGRRVKESSSAEEKLRESQARLQSIIRVAPIGIGMVRNRILLEVNQRVCEMTGYKTEELIGSDARIFYLSQEEYAFVGSEKYRQINEKGSGTVETRWQHKNGTVMDILLSSTPLEPSDLSKGVIFTALNITERKKAELALRQS